MDHIHLFNVCAYTISCTLLVQELIDTTFLKYQQKNVNDLLHKMKYYTIYFTANLTFFRGFFVFMIVRLILEKKFKLNNLVISYENCIKAIKTLSKGV